MDKTKKNTLLSTCFVSYAILQSIFVVLWSIVAVVIAGILLLGGIMSHGNNSYRNNFLLTVFALVIVIGFAIISGRIIFKAGRTLQNSSGNAAPVLKKGAIWTIIGVLINGITLVITAIVVMTEQPH
jgi:hypothetical protein